MFAMGGASREHNIITLNVGSGLHGQLSHRSCEVYQADMRVRVSPSGLYTYPDIAVVCGEPQFEDAELDTLLNPSVLLEVLSESTEDYDRGTKFEHYRQIQSLTDYVLIAQKKPHVEHFHRQPDGRWILWETNSLDDELDLPSIGCQLKLADIYAKVTFPSDGLT
jgi:Uma2 family endonuclease